MTHKHGPAYDFKNCIDCCRAAYSSTIGNVNATKSMLAHIAGIPGSPGAEGARKRLETMNG